MAAPPNLKAAGQGGNPAVDYQPLSSPVLGYGDDDDGNSDERRWKFSIELSTIFRLMLVILTLADIILWAIDATLIHKSPSWLVFTEFFFLIIWNLYVLFPKARLPKVLPNIVFQVGDSTWVLHEGRGDAPLRTPRTTKQKRNRCFRTAAVDMIFGLTIVIITSVVWSDLHWWYLQRAETLGILPITMTIGALEIFISLITFAAGYWRLVFEFGAVLKSINAPDSYTRVQLAPDTEDRRTAAGTVSIAG